MSEAAPEDLRSYVVLALGGGGRLWKLSPFSETVAPSKTICAGTLHAYILAHYITSLGPSFLACERGTVLLWHISPECT